MRVVRFVYWARLGWAACPLYYLVAEMMTGSCSDECDESYSDDDHLQPTDDRPEQRLDFNIQ